MAKITKYVSVMCFYFNEGIELAIPATYYKEIVVQTETNLTF